MPRWQSRGALVFDRMFVMSTQPPLVTIVLVAFFGLFHYLCVVKKLHGGERHQTPLRTV